MKKLVLALVCLVSVAFFASCDPKVEHPEPTIAFVAGEGLITEDAVISTGDTACFDIKAMSNVETNKLLKSLYLQVFTDEGSYDDTIFSDINQNSFEYFFGYIFRDAGIYTVSATVTDADGYSAECRLNLTVNQSDTPLIASTFTWNRHGGGQATGLEQFGLKWTSNGKEDFAKITPMEGVTLYEFYADDWDNINTVNQKNILFSLAMENGNDISLFNKVSAWTTHDYNYVIGTVMPDGTCHLMHITKGEVSTFKGTDITITGEAK